MYSEKYIKNIIEMETSFNCSVLSNETLKSLNEFSVNIFKKDNEIFTDLGNNRYDIEKFKVDHLKDYICKVTNSDKHATRLWKVNVVDEVGIKEKLKDENEMKPRLLFSDYFQDELSGEAEFTVTNIHIISTTSTAGPSQQGVQGPNWNDPSSIYEWIKEFSSNRGRGRLVKSYGADFEFLKRDDTIDVLWNGLATLDGNGLDGIVTRFENRNVNDKSFHPIPVLAGGPGVGKSRFLDEVEELIKKKAEESHNNAFTNMIAINTTYGNSTVADNIDAKIQAQASLAIRILFEYFRPEHKDHESYNFVRFRSCCRDHYNNSSDVSDFTLDTALRIIYKDFVQINPTTPNPQLVLVLGIDEFNKLYHQDKVVCRELIHAIGGTMCGSPANIFFIPILAGTIEGPLNNYISGSMHEPLPLPLHLLNDEDAIRIGMKMNLFDNEYVKLHPYFRLSISDIGGHVRSLEYYYKSFSNQLYKELTKLKTQMMTEEEKLKTAVYNVNIERAMGSVKEKIIKKYQLERNSCWLTVPLANAILGFPVQKMDVITVNNKSMTYMELSSMGVVNLVLMEQTNYLIRLPYVWICAIIESSNDTGIIYWKSMLKYDEPMNWLNFEDFNTKFWALRLILFRLIGYEKINLKTLFKGADFSLNFPDVEVDLPQVKDIKLYKLLHRYPVTKTYENTQVKYANITEIRNGYIDLDLLKNENIKSYIGCVFLNASGAPFDAFGYLNKSSESASEICIAQQSKSTITSKVVINQNFFNNEYKKATEAMDVDEDEENFVFLFLTNAIKKNNLSIDDKPNSALVSVENFQKFYGYTYTNRAQFASANEQIYLNNAPVESLVILGFNENERIDIRLKRKERSFDNLCDLKERLGIGDERLKKLRLDRISFS